jgi:hypothetical protein
MYADTVLEELRAKKYWVLHAYMHTQSTTHTHTRTHARTQAQYA